MAKAMEYRNIAAVYKIKTSLITFSLFQRFLIHAAAIFLSGMFLKKHFLSQSSLKLLVKYSSPKN